MVEVHCPQTVSEWFNHAAESTEAALALSAKYQQECMWWWAKLAGGADSVEAFQKRAATISTDAISAAQQASEAHLLALEETYRQGMYLLCQPAESEGVQSMKDLHSRMETFWENTLNALRVNTQNFLHMNRQAMECWAQLTCGNGESPAAASDQPAARQARRPVAAEFGRSVV